MIIALVGSFFSIKMFLARKMTSLYREKKRSFSSCKQNLIIFEVFLQNTQSFTGKYKTKCNYTFLKYLTMLPFKIVSGFITYRPPLHWNEDQVFSASIQNGRNCMAEILHDDVFSSLCERRRKYKYFSLHQKFQSEISWPICDTGYLAQFLVTLRSADPSVSHRDLSS